MHPTAGLQYSTVLYCTVLYCTVLYCTVLVQYFRSSGTGISAGRYRSR